MGSLTTDTNDLNLNDYEQQIYDYIIDHEGKNGKEIASYFDGKISKNSVNKYLDKLEDYHDIIESLQFSQGEKTYFLRKKDFPSSNEFNASTKEDFEIRKSIIRKSLKYVQNQSRDEKIFVYTHVIKVIFSLHNFLKLLQAINPDKKIKRWSDYEKESLDFLEEVLKIMDQGIVAAIMGNSDLEDLQKLENYIKHYETKSLE
jgi:hypothetical protein